MIIKINKIPKWLKKGIGVNGGGDYIGSQIVSGQEVKLIMEWKGIHGTIPYPAYFELNGKLYRISNKDIKIQVWR